MKKLFISFFLLFAPFVVLAQTFEKDLYFGIQGDSEVTKLQEFLIEQGVYSGPITGNFFSLTLKAVRDFQVKEGISPAAGYFGPLTRTKANTMLSSQISASNEQAVSEVGSVPTAPEPPKTTTDVAKSLQDQINLLLQQITLLQQQLNTQKATEQKIQSLDQKVTEQTNVIQQQQETISKIQQNATPLPQPKIDLDALKAEEESLKQERASKTLLFTEVTSAQLALCKIDRRQNLKDEKFFSYWGLYGYQVDALTEEQIDEYVKINPGASNVGQGQYLECIQPENTRRKSSEQLAARNRIFEIDRRLVQIQEIMQ